MTAARNELKVKLMKEFVFLVAHIRDKYQSYADANAAGYSIEFEEGPSDAFGNGSREIPLAKSGVNSRDVVEHNASTFNALVQHYGGLTVVLRWKREVARPETDDEEELQEFDESADSEGRLFFSEEYKLSLYHLARDCFMHYTFHKKEEELFAVCPQIFRAIHVLALGFRGLLKEATGELQTVEEKAARECCTTDRFSDNSATRTTCRLNESASAQGDLSTFEKEMRNRIRMRYSVYKVRMENARGERSEGRNGNAGGILNNVAMNVDLSFLSGAPVS